MAAGGNKDVSKIVVDSYLSPIPCKTSGILWSRYSYMNNDMKYHGKDKWLLVARLDQQIIPCKVIWPKIS